MASTARSTRLCSRVVAQETRRTAPASAATTCFMTGPPRMDRKQPRRTRARLQLFRLLRCLGAAGGCVGRSLGCVDQAEFAAPDAAIAVAVDGNPVGLPCFVAGKLRRAQV